MPVPPMIAILMTIADRRVRLEIPTLEVVPWVYLKDHEFRYPGLKPLSVMEVNCGHAGFICEHPDGFTAEANLNGTIYKLDDVFPAVETAVSAIFAKREKVAFFNRVVAEMIASDNESRIADGQSEERDPPLTVEKAEAILISRGVKP